MITLNSAKVQYFYCETTNLFLDISKNEQLNEKIVLIFRAIILFIPTFIKNSFNYYHFSKTSMDNRIILPQFNDYLNEKIIEQKTPITGGVKSFFKDNKSTLIKMVAFTALIAAGYYYFNTNTQDLTEVSKKLNPIEAPFISSKSKESYPIIVDKTCPNPFRNLVSSAFVSSNSIEDKINDIHESFLRTLELIKDSNHFKSYDDCLSYVEKLANKFDFDPRMIGEEKASKISLLSTMISQILTIRNFSESI